MVLKLLLLCFCLQVTQNDEIYVDREARKAGYENIHIISITAHSPGTAEVNGIHNKGVTSDNEANDEKDESEETLSPEDLMAFAWQISQGMVRHFEVKYKHGSCVFHHFRILRKELKIRHMADYQNARTVLWQSFLLYWLSCHYIQQLCYYIR